MTYICMSYAHVSACTYVLKNRLLMALLMLIQTLDYSLFNLGHAITICNVGVRGGPVRFGVQNPARAEIWF